MPEVQKNPFLSRHVDKFWSFVDGLTPQVAMAGTATGLLISIALGLAVGEIDWQFGEGKLVTWLSFVLLALTGAVSFRIYGLRREWTGLRLSDPRSIWLFVAIGFFYLGMDEAWEFHENLDRFGHFILGAEQSALSDRADDLIIAFYGIVGLAALWLCRSEIIKFKQLKFYFWAGFMLLALQVALDAVSNGNEYLKLLKNAHFSKTQIKAVFEVAEESVKVFAEVFFLSGFLLVLKECSSRNN